MMLALVILLLVALVVSVTGQFVMSIQMRRIENRVSNLTRVLSTFADNAANGFGEDHF